jgi:NAD(P)-dependent dehydrogenase (short-subunit alcohol dehydrogenase family)
MSNDHFRLDGRVAVVTGSTKGIGKAMARGLAEAGARVVVSSRKQRLCDEVARELREETGATVEGIACHVGEWDAIPAFVEAVRERLGGIHVLVNNAGINPARVNVQHMTLEFWRKLFSVNLEGPLRLSQLVAPVMRDLGGGSIVNIATMAAYSGGSNVCAYGASKAALVNLTKSMAQEFAPWNVRVNVLSPGPFLTEMVEGGERTALGFKERIAEGTMLRRVADPGEIVGPVLYLASDASSFVTGDDISVSGGMYK